MRQGITDSREGGLKRERPLTGSRFANGLDQFGLLKVLRDHVRQSLQQISKRRVKALLRLPAKVLLDEREVVSTLSLLRPYLLLSISCLAWFSKPYASSSACSRSRNLERGCWSVAVAITPWVSKRGCLAAICRRQVCNRANRLRLSLARLTAERISSATARVELTGR